VRTIQLASTQFRASELQRRNNLSARIQRIMSLLEGQSQGHYLFHLYYADQQMRNIHILTIFDFF